jgi:hypothetical protein
MIQQTFKAGDHRKDYKPPERRLVDKGPNQYFQVTDAVTLRGAP